jgi:hypothetical protein
MIQLDKSKTILPSIIEGGFSPSHPFMDHQTSDNSQLFEDLEIVISHISYALSACLHLRSPGSLASLTILFLLATYPFLPIILGQVLSFKPCSCIKPAWLFMFENLKSRLHPAPEIPRGLCSRNRREKRG